MLMDSTVLRKRVRLPTTTINMKIIVVHLGIFQLSKPRSELPLLSLPLSYCITYFASTYSIGAGIDKEQVSQVGFADAG
jgi:hypothetical protein